MVMSAVQSSGIKPETLKGVIGGNPVIVTGGRLLVKKADILF